MAHDYTKYVLKNGVRVILVPQAGSVATTVAVLVEAGSKYETKDKNGISHFLEHMCFKGTANRPKSTDISRELDGLGAVYNAFTGQEMTSYYAKAQNGVAPRIFDVVSDLYLNPLFPKEEIEKEKGVIIEEIHMYEDMPQRKVGDLFMNLVYGDQPAGWDIAGRTEVIQRTTQADFLTYRGKHYLPQATVLVVAGGFDEARMRKDIASSFGKLAAGKKGKKPRVTEEQERPAELIHFKEVEQTHLIMGFRGFDAFDKRKATLEVLADILGGGMSSRLFKRVRDELGAAYYVNASAEFFTDHGLITMSAGAKHEKLEAVLRAGLEEFTRFTKEPVAKEELARAKSHLVGNFLIALETSDELGYFYGGQEVLGLRLKTPAEEVREIQAVTASDIRSVARSLFRNDRLNLALIGPFKKRSFADIVRV
jgi:predicted Zn-dependent peptidase